MFWFIRTCLSFTALLLWADRKRWREILPVCFFATGADLCADVIMHHYELWTYDDSSLFVDLLDDFSVYPVVAYLFIQYLPQQQSWGRMLLYWFAWTSFALGAEWIHLYAGAMHYHKWWTLGYSYIADWILFWIFYQYYKIFGFQRLNLEDHTLKDNDNKQ